MGQSVCKCAVPHFSRKGLKGGREGFLSPSCLYSPPFQLRRLVSTLLFFSAVWLLRTVGGSTVPTERGAQRWWRFSSLSHSKCFSFFMHSWWMLSLLEVALSQFELATTQVDSLMTPPPQSTPPFRCKFNPRGLLRSLQYVTWKVLFVGTDKYFEYFIIMFIKGLHYLLCYWSRYKVKASSVPHGSLVSWHLFSTRSEERLRCLSFFSSMWFYTVQYYSIAEKYTEKREREIGFWGKKVKVAKCCQPTYAVVMLQRG